MHRFSPRRFRQWVAAPLLLTQVGCAAQAARVSSLPATGSQGERKACEDFSAKQKQKSVAGMVALGVGLVPFGIALGGLGAMAGHPEGLELPIFAFATAASNAKENRAAREVALKLCLEPRRLERTLGPEHPDVARALSALAQRYVSMGELANAAPLYERALAIREKTLGLDHPDVAATLEDYAILLRKAKRDSEAGELESRAKTIRAKSGQQGTEDPTQQVLSDPRGAKRGGL